MRTTKLTNTTDQQRCYETDVFSITYRQNALIEKLLPSLLSKASKIAWLFGLSHLPPDTKISIQLMEKEPFTQQCSLYFGQNTNSQIVAFSTTQIYALSYDAICGQYTSEAYYQVILHEIVHVLQLFATRVPIPPNVWLYEAIACYLAEQVTELPPQPPSQETAPPWEIVKQNFYAVPKCYTLAYHLGKALLSHCPPSDIITLCSDVPRCEAICAQAYQAIVSPSTLVG